MKSILDPTFRYTPSYATDLWETFARVRREQAEAKAKPARVEPVVAFPRAEARRQRGFEPAVRP